MEIRKIKKNLFPVLVIVLVLGIGFFLDEPVCLIKRTTGLPCPSCGMSRSFLALFRGDIQQAFFMHPLFFTIPFIGILFYLTQTRKQDYTKFYIFFIVIFLLTYIIRMILLFPHTAPMDFLEQSLIGRLFFH